MITIIRYVFSRSIFLFLLMFFVFLFIPFHPLAAQTIRGEALVLLNSRSPSFNDFKRYIQPYLDNFGVPYIIVDIASTPVDPSVGDFSLIIIGHRELDPNKSYLNTNEETYLSNAIRNGTGLINFDYVLQTSENFSRYQFIQDIFSFNYMAPSTGNGVKFSQMPHYITGNHQPGDTMGTQVMRLSGIIVPNNATSLAMSNNEPFLVITKFGLGRGVQWGTYDWISSSVKGPVFGLDDLIWRSIVWAARKPFVMRGLPPFIAMRVDDTAGPLWWIETANDVGLKPWVGLFIDQIDNSEAEHLATLVENGKATATIHAFTKDDFFFSPSSGGNWPDETMAAYYKEGTQWHILHNIPISKFVVPHYYQIGANAFNGLKNWGVEFIGTVMNPGTSYGSSWIVGGPYRLFEQRQSSQSQGPFYYADFITVPNHPELNNQFFNCMTEIRDDAGYEWYPNNDVQGSIGRGTRQLKRALESIVLPTLFTHEYYIQAIARDRWRTILQGIINNLQAFNPFYVTMDYACQYLRALRTSKIANVSYDPVLKTVDATFLGQSDTNTIFHVFTGTEDGISPTIFQVPAFTESTTIRSDPLTVALDHYIVVNPRNAKLAVGETQQFTATAYDVNGNAVPNLTFNWSAKSGGNISRSGLFSAGSMPGVYANEITASVGTIAGHASLDLYIPTFDLTVQKTLTSRGIVTSVPTGINCGNACNVSISKGTVVDLTATPTTDSIFGGWSGCDSAADTVCTVLVNSNRSVTATFYLAYSLVVNHDGTGDGGITSVPSGIDCESTCSDAFVVGTPVRLTARPYDGSVFSFWSGGCAGTTETCDLTMTDDIEVAAHFVPYGTKKYHLTVKRVKKNRGDGVVISNDWNIDCGDTCSQTYYKDTIVTLSATANESSTFSDGSRYSQLPGLPTLVRSGRQS